MRNTIRDFKWNKECYKLLGIQQKVPELSWILRGFSWVAKSARLVMTTMMKIVTFPSYLIFYEPHYLKKPLRNLGVIVLTNGW